MSSGTMPAFFSAPRKINLGCSGFQTVFKNILNKKRKIKHVTSKWRTSGIIQQIFVFDKTYNLVLKDSTLVHPKSAPSVHPRVHFFKVYFFVSCFPTMSLNRTKVRHYEAKGLWKNYIDDWVWCNISPWTKEFSFSASWVCILSVP